MTQLILKATNKRTDKEIFLKINNSPKTDLAIFVLQCFTNELIRYKETGNIHIEATNLLVSFMHSMACFGGESDEWTITDQDSNILIFGQDGSHSFIRPEKKTKRFSWKDFLVKIFEREVKQEVKPMATRLTTKRGEKR